MVIQIKIRVTMITKANILATSFDVPRISPVAQIKDFLDTNAIIAPDKSPIVTPTIPMVLNIRNPSAKLIINDSKSFFIFIDSMNGLPVPSGNAFENVAHVTIPILAAISEINST